MMKKLRKIYEINKEVINYIIFGVLTTVTNLVTYFALTFILLDVNNSLELQIANVISWVFAVIFAYVTNKRYVFESKNKNIIRELINFFIARLATLFIDMVVMYLGVNVLLFNDKIIKIISQIIVIVSNYILSKFFVFNCNRKKYQGTK